MDTAEFTKLWRLLEELFPAAAKKKSDKAKAVWERGLTPYRLEDAADAAMSYARKNKFFPDLSDITGGLTEIAPPSAPGAGGAGYRLNPEEIQQMRRHIQQLQQDAARLRGSAGKEPPNEI